MFLFFKAIFEKDNYLFGCAESSLWHVECSIFTVTRGDLALRLGAPRLGH